MSGNLLIILRTGCRLGLGRFYSSRALTSRQLAVESPGKTKTIRHCQTVSNSDFPDYKTTSKKDVRDIKLEVTTHEIPKGLFPSSKSASLSVPDPSPPEPDKLYKKIELEVLGYESSVLDSYQWFVLAAAKHLNLKVGKVWAPHKSDKYRFNLLASVHIFKKHQVHYEVRTYHRFINIHKLTGSTADTFLEYIQRNLPEGVGLKVTKVEVHPKPDFWDKSSSSQ